MLFFPPCVEGCPANAPPLYMLDQHNYALDSIPQFISFAGVLRSGASQIEEICGEPPVSILETADAVSSTLCGVADILRDIRIFFNCENWYPLYEGITYQTVCYSGTEGFAWVASTQFVIAFMTMVILTLRVTFYEVEAEEVEDLNVKDETSSEPEETEHSL